MAPESCKSKIDSPGKLTLRQTAKVCAGTDLDRRNYLVSILWLSGWAVAFVYTKSFQEGSPGEQTVMIWVLTIATTAIGSIALYCYARFLQLADGILRQIQLESLACGFGTAIIVGVGYSPFENLGLPTLQVDHLIVAMTIGWIAGHLISLLNLRTVLTH